MQRVEETEVIDVELDAVMRFQRTDDTIECIILNIARDLPFNRLWSFVTASFKFLT